VHASGRSFFSGYELQRLGLVRRFNLLPSNVWWYGDLESEQLDPARCYLELTLTTMRSLQITVRAVLILATFVLSPAVLPCMCVLRSTVIALPLSILCALVLPWMAFRQASPLRHWILIGLAPLASFFASESYHSWLHSDEFPEALLDRASVTAMQRYEEARKRAVERYKR
jgi:hypothetical protein